MTLYRSTIVSAVVSTLTAAGTLAASSIYAARDWPLTAVKLPSIMVKAPTERKESAVRGVPSFTTVATIALLIRATGANSQAVEATLETLCGQVEQAVLSAGSAVQLLIQQFVSVDTEIRTSSEGGAVVGDAIMQIACEFFERFPPLASQGTPLSQIGLVLTPAGTNPAPVLAGVSGSSPGAPPPIQP